jgi:hypothetical protein
MSCVAVVLRRICLSFSCCAQNKTLSKELNEAKKDNEKLKVKVRFERVCACAHTAALLHVMGFRRVVLVAQVAEAKDGKKDKSSSGDKCVRSVM